LSKRSKRRTAKIILVYCPVCTMLFYDAWKEPTYWLRNSMQYICPYCETILLLDWDYEKP